MFHKINQLYSIKKKQLWILMDGFFKHPTYAALSFDQEAVGDNVSPVELINQSLNCVSSPLFLTGRFLFGQKLKHPFSKIKIRCAVDVL